MIPPYNPRFDALKRLPGLPAVNHSLQIWLIAPVSNLFLSLVGTSLAILQPAQFPDDNDE
jgi:hypothetical protein